MIENEKTIYKKWLFIKKYDTCFYNLNLENFKLNNNVLLFSFNWKKNKYNLSLIKNVLLKNYKIEILLNWKKIYSKEVSNLLDLKKEISTNLKKLGFKSLLDINNDILINKNNNVQQIPLYKFENIHIVFKLLNKKNNLLTTLTLPIIKGIKLNFYECEINVFEYFKYKKFNLNDISIELVGWIPMKNENEEKPIPFYNCINKTKQLYEMYNFIDVKREKPIKIYI